MSEELKELLEEIMAVHAAALAKLAEFDSAPADDDVVEEPADEPVDEPDVEEPADAEAEVPEVNEMCPTCGAEWSGNNGDDETRDEVGEVELRWFSAPSATSEKREYASIAIPAEVRELADGQVAVSGYAAVFNQPSLDLGFTERIAPGAFKRTLAMDGDVRLLIEHDGVAIARTKSGTLQVVEDERGLRIDATVDPANPKVAEVVSALRRGDLDGMSFGFRAIKDSWNESRTERTLEELQLFEVSLVTFPAYPQTQAVARSEQAAVEESVPVRARKLSAARVRLLDL